MKQSVMRHLPLLAGVALLSLWLMAGGQTADARRRAALTPSPEPGTPTPGLVTPPTATPIPAAPTETPAGPPATAVAPPAPGGGDDEDSTPTPPLAIATPGAATPSPAPSATPAATATSAPTASPVIPRMLPNTGEGDAPPLGLAALGAAALLAALVGRAARTGPPTD